MTSQRWVIGTVVAIEIEKDRFSLGLLLKRPYVAFLDGVYGPEYAPTDEALAQAKVLFICGIYRDAISRGTWKKMGQAPDLAKNIAIPTLCMHSKFSTTYTKLLSDGRMVPATREECVALEPAAVWEAPAVEDRIRDTIAGRQNKWLQSMRE